MSDILKQNEFAVELTEGASFTLTSLTFKDTGKNTEVDLEMVFNSTIGPGVPVAQMNRTSPSEPLGDNVGDCGIFALDHNYAPTTGVNFNVGWKSGTIVIYTNIPTTGRKGDHGPQFFADMLMKVKRLEEERDTLKATLNNLRDMLA